MSPVLIPHRVPLALPVLPQERPKALAEPVAPARNLLRYAAHGAARPVAELPANFEGQLKAMGY
jgi:hypothetical protein